MRVALEVQHRVDDVLEHARPGDARLPWSRGRPGSRSTSRCLASRVSCAAHSRTCATLPGAEVQRLGVDGLDRVDDRRPRAPRRRWSRRSSRAGSRPAAITARVGQTQALRAQRDLLDRLLAGDVEHLARRADGAPAPAAAASTCRCPDRRRAGSRAPGTSPPPSTRSNSSMPVGCAGSLRGRMAPARSTAPAVPARRPGSASRAAPATVSTSVFQAPQWGHWPCHFGLWPPHSVQL